MDPSQTPQTPVSTPQGRNPNMLAIISYLGILVIIPLAMNKNDKFVKFHSKQGLVLLIAGLAAWAVTRFFWIIIPIFGWLGSQILYLGCFVLAIIGIINAANGQTKELPIIGKFARNFKF